MYVVVDLDTLKEKAYPTLQAARFAALDVNRGEVHKVVLDTSLPSPQLRCALFNHDGYAAERTMIAAIINGVARKVSAQ